jgi:hypothetical protein
MISSIRIAIAPPAKAEFTVLGAQNPYSCGELSPLSM